MEQIESEIIPKSRKSLEHLLLFFALIGSVVVIAVYANLYTRYTSTHTPNSLIYGVWIEQKVASYNKDELHINEEGISRRGATITTQFDFDGKSIRYRVGDQDYVLKVTGTDYSELTLELGSYYNPTFMRKDHVKTPLR
ncbi:hypothetical protein BCU68_05610 [Vibrio sp. 10N.286.49.B3]|uniref:DUF2850 domain-containing protein n=1 Tax=Vibrio sp. 10N.286.49.B3 TaxID=1880855 RepID=UPI000C828D46|nr:DUF2850 domain-containing protein [Vibrio sp. 10N.286.49.B3]PMH41157.1 hypothetical protein BCU68_05610 [Vibrio sp. 10N.286.49.B3]